MEITLLRAQLLIRHSSQLKIGEGKRKSERVQPWNGSNLNNGTCSQHREMKLEIQILSAV